jgi:hypothetical protein
VIEIISMYMDFDGLLLKVYIMLILKIDDYLYNVPKTRIKYQNITMDYTIAVFITIGNFGLHYCSDYQIKCSIINLSIHMVW